MARASIGRIGILAALIGASDANAVTWQQICATSPKAVTLAAPSAAAIENYQRLVEPAASVPAGIQDHNGVINFDKYAVNTKITTQYKADLKIEFAACHGFGATCVPTPPVVVVQANSYSSRNQALTALSQKGMFGELVSISGTFNSDKTAKRIALKVAAIGTFSYAAVYFIDKSGKILETVNLKKGWNNEVVYAGAGVLGFGVSAINASNSAKLNIVLDDIKFDLLPSACGDSRDALIKQYSDPKYAGGYPFKFKPVCETFTRSARSDDYTFAQLTVDNGNLTWAPLREPLIRKNRASEPGGKYGLTAWVDNAGGSPVMTSAYRSPAAQLATGSTGKFKRHSHGDAADLKIKKGVNLTLKDWCNFNKAALVAEADYIEEPPYGCIKGSKAPYTFICAHADWRYHVAGYSRTAADRTASVPAPNPQYPDAALAAAQAAIADRARPIVADATPDSALQLQSIQQLTQRLQEADALRSMNEDAGEVYIATLRQLADIQHPQVLDILADEDMIATSDVTISGLARQGAGAVPKLAQVYSKTREPIVKLAIHKVYERLLAMGTLDNTPALYATVRSQLLAGARHPDPFVRITAASALGGLRADPTVRRVLQTLATTDPDQVAGPQHRRYRVREQAAEALGALGRP